ncbi:RNA ligase family protein [Nocardiopsis sp. FR26]|uniref:RNA ligase family protein n=1 Tax=Nocardiopsis sp. FR26 TaxID=2605987 RepID=UPI001357E7B9|nr:RNA ligase family protein [Nocardiopsis sp. FR26]
MTLLETLNRRLLNSATQYPKMPTYHKLERGLLTDDRNTVFPAHQPVIITEKVNGASARVVVDSSGDLFIGSRHELLYALGDRIPNPAENIVHTLRDIARDLPRPGDGLAVYFLEVYGSGIGSAWKQYTGRKGEYGARLFDAAMIPADALEGTAEQIAAWREQGGQKFATEKELAGITLVSDIPLTPRIATIPGAGVPATIAEMHPYLCVVAGETRVALDEDGFGNAEGIVLRTPDRSHIVKVRHKDYEHTAKARARARAKAA